MKEQKTMIDWGWWWHVHHGWILTTAATVMIVGSLLYLLS